MIAEFEDSVGFPYVGSPNCSIRRTVVDSDVISPRVHDTEDTITILWIDTAMTCLVDASIFVFARSTPMITLYPATF